jgi:hypothetical protein
MSRTHHGHPFRFLATVFLTILCLPFVLFLSVLAAPAILFFAPIIALWGLERAVVEHEPARRLSRPATPAHAH